jgi:hypothetical protein
MQLAMSGAALPQPTVEPAPQPPPDLRELAGSIMSLGSFGLRWQMIEPAHGRTIGPPDHPNREACSSQGR